MFDVIVFPSPDTDQEYEKWDREGWKPATLAHPVIQLGDHAVARGSA